MILNTKALAFDLVRDGKAVSTIVIPDQATETEQGAAERLVKYLKMASGAELPIVKESAKPENVTLISVGKTKMANEAGITEEGLKYDGYHLAVKDTTLYLVGRDTDFVLGQSVPYAELMAGAQGTIRAALGLLDCLGFRWLQPTPMGTYVPELRTVSVPDDLNLTYEPPLMYLAGRMWNWGDWSLANGYRTAIKNLTLGGHTWPIAVPDTFFEEHPEYFVMVDGERMLKPADRPHHHPAQYCSSNPQAQRLVAEWTMRFFEQGYEMVQLGATDGFEPCQCPLCSKLSPADQVHNAYRKILEMIREKYPEGKVQVIMYGPTSEMPPPSFEPYPPNAAMEVAIMGSPGSSERLEFWASAMPGGTMVYAYEMGPYYSDGLAPRFYPERAAAKIKYWIAHNVNGIYLCGGGENWGAEGPTYYLLGRLATYPTLDWEEVYEEYLNLTFRKAAPAMRQYYDALSKRLARFRDPENDTLLAGLGEDGQFLSPGRTNIKHPFEMWVSVYPEKTLVELQGYLDEARKQAGDDERAQGWIRVAQISYEHYALIARMFHEGQKFRSWQTLGFAGKGQEPKSRDELRKRAQAYYTWVDEIVKLDETDPEFRKNFIPDCPKHGAIWSDKEFLRTNSHWHGLMPPVWFE